MDLKHQILLVADYFVKTRSIILTARNLSLSTGTVRKMLITANVWNNKRSQEIARYRREHPGCDSNQIAEGLSISTKTVQLYSPYEGMDLLGQPECTNNPQEEETVEKGQCGDNAFWELRKNGVLQIIGKGPLWDYGARNGWGTCGTLPKWCSRRDGYSVEKIIINEGITVIGEYAFADLIDLKEISLPKTLKRIEGGAFVGENYLKKVVLPEGIDRITWDTFYRCFYLEEVHIPASVRKIQTYAFHGCVSLRRMYFYGDAPRIAVTTFDRCPGGALTVYYKDGGKGFEEGMWNGYRTMVYE